MKKEYNNVDHQLTWEEFWKEHMPSEAESVKIFRELEKMMSEEKNSERKEILNLIYWLNDKVKDCEDAQKIYNKYKNENNPNKAFEYLYKKLPGMLHYSKEAIAAINKINEIAMEMYGKILEMEYKSEMKDLEKWYNKLEEFDKNNN